MKLVLAAARRVLAVLAARLLAVALTVIVGTACSGTAALATTFTPITGVIVRADALVTGIGCGTKNDQVFKYVSVLGQGNAPLVASSADCFSDTKFANLINGPDGTLSFIVTVYAFSQAAYQASNTNGDVDNVSHYHPRTTNPNDPNAPVDLTDPAIAAFSKTLAGFHTSYKTTCTATQQQDVEVLAVCTPLQAGGPGTVRIDTATFARKNGAALACHTDYDKVQAFFSVNGSVGELAFVDCPAPIVITPAQAPATYTFDVQLIDPTGAIAVATAHCTANTSPNLEIAATCAPAE